MSASVKPPWLQTQLAWHRGKRTIGWLRGGRFELDNAFSADWNERRYHEHAKFQRAKHWEWEYMLFR